MLNNASSQLAHTSAFWFLFFSAFGPKNLMKAAFSIVRSSEGTCLGRQFGQWRSCGGLTFCFLSVSGRCGFQSLTIRRALWADCGCPCGRTQTAQDEVCGSQRNARVRGGCAPARTIRRSAEGMRNSSRYNWDVGRIGSVKGVLSAAIARRCDR